MFAVYSCTRARSLPGLANKCVWDTNRTRTETHLRVVRFVLLLCAHVLTIAGVNEELKCKLLILFCSGEGGWPGILSVKSGLSGSQPHMGPP